MGTTLLGAPRDLVNAIKKELGRYPVKYDFEHGGKHPYVAIESQSGERRKVSFSISPRSEHVAIMSTIGVIRRTMKAMNVAAYPECKRDVKTGTLGIFMAEAASKAGDAPRVEALPHAPPPDYTPSPDFDDDGDAFEPAGPSVPLCPDAIRERALRPTPEPERTRTMLTRPDPQPQAQDQTEPRRRGRLSDAEIATATRLIITNADVNDADRIVTYRDGWNDARVAEIVATMTGRDSRADIVATLRRKSFGLTIEERAAATPHGDAAPSGLADALARIADLARRVERLEEAVTRP